MDKNKKKLLAEIIQKRLNYYCDKTRYRYELGRACVDSFIDDIISDFATALDKNKEVNIESEILKTLIGDLESGIKDFYFHRNFDSGRLELNIEFNKEADDILQKKYLEKELIKKIDDCACWE